MIYMTKIDPAQNMARVYVLDVQPTLFSEWTFVDEWGRHVTTSHYRRPNLRFG